MADARRGLNGLGHVVAKAQDAALEEHGALKEARGRLLDRASPHVARSSRPLTVGLAAAAVALLALAVALWPRPSRLTFVVGDQPGEVGRWLAAREAPLDVRFSDGSRISFAPRSGGRVQVAHERGARVLIEHGSVELTIMHLPAARWEVEAGPFHVLVLGTRFHLRWDPTTQQFTLSLGRGKVRLEGPVVGSRIVNTGEMVQIQVTQGRLQLTEGRGTTGPRAGTGAGTDPKAGTGAGKAGTGAGTDPKAGTGAGTDPKAGTGAGTDPKAGTGAGTDPLRLVRAGRYRAATRAADRRGPASTLLALADAARLAGEHSRALSIYRKLRVRFPTSEAAATAAFALGREAFDRRQDYSTAAKWFEVYLEERPTGSLTREALGRLLEARHLDGDRPRAVHAARRYLRAYPDGPHARLAQTVAGGSP